jgi:transposase
MSEPIIWVGLDVHKDSITAAVLEGDAFEAEVMRLPADLLKVRRFFRRLGQRGRVQACYEASGAGYVLQRSLEKVGIFCEVVAPSLIPKKPGDRRKTDRTDAVMLARLYRSGHLTPVRVPDEDQEAVRRLVRLRFSYQEQTKDTKRRIHTICLAQGWVYRETKTLWTLQHRTWLNQLQQDLTGPLATVLRTELQHLEYLETQRDSLDAEIDRYARRAPYRESVLALCCLRGVKTLTAMILLTEIGDIRRFRSPRALMAWVGLVPRERSSGARERRGRITKTGNAHVRRILIETGWQQRHRSRANTRLTTRRQGMPAEIVAIAVKAQHRLSNRFRRLERRKDNRIVVAAVARELCGFVWALMNAVPQPS